MLKHTQKDSVSTRSESTDTRRRRGRLVKRILRNKSIIFGGGLFLVFVLLAILGPVLSQQDPMDVSVRDRLMGPARTHLLGTDQMGRDILSRILYGIGLSLLVGTTVVALASSIGIMLGLIGAYAERIGPVIMRLVDGLMAFPGLILALALVAVLGSRLENIIAALTFVYTPRVARVVHAITLELKTREFVYAARAIGVSSFSVMMKHIFPNALGPAVVQSSFMFASAILSEASLSFLGVGLPPGTPSLGVMLSEGRMYLLNAPWIVIFPGATLFVMSLGLNIVGDGVRDLLDPRYRSGT